MSERTAIPLPIQQLNEFGQLINTYGRLADARTSNKISFLKLESLLLSGETYKGFSYKASGPLPKMVIDRITARLTGEEPSYVPHWEGPQPWEGENGFFDIRGWKKVL